MVLRLIRRAASRISAAMQPTRPPAMPAGMPTSKTANQAVAGLTFKPMISPAMAPITPPVAAPRVAHRFSTDQGRSSARSEFIGRIVAPSHHAHFASRAVGPEGEDLGGPRRPSPDPSTAGPVKRRGCPWLGRSEVRQVAPSISPSTPLDHQEFGTGSTSRPAEALGEPRRH